jgi:tRNA (guanine-N7-)-methyltransferase
VNIRVHPDDARPLLRWLPARCLGRVFILFPDPWPKRRHHKRRLISAATLEALARLMRPGGELRIATDDSSYLRSILIEMIRVPEFAWTAERAADWRERSPDWPPTRYEMKAVRAGRRCAYLTFLRI